jgi:hypothetical protein
MSRLYDNTHPDYAQTDNVKVFFFFFFFFFLQALNFLVESFGPLNDLFPLPSILDAGYQFLIFIWQMSCLMLSSHLYLGLPCDLLVRGFQLNIFLTVHLTVRTMWMWGGK